MPSARVLVAMSGGVDSAVAAARLVDEGLDVVGVTLHLWDYPDEARDASRCCAPEDQHDARRQSDFLGIPHYSFDRRELFRDHVVTPFVDAYLAGETPSPCVSCNRSVKLRELFALAERLGATHVATGHYARVVDAGGRLELWRGVDRHKDQSYYLHMLRQDELSRLRLPLGASTKPEVRAEAVARRLPGADKGESQELCFVPTGGYAAFVEERAASRVRPGPILDEAGRVVGQHDGIHRFTVGQRRGLGVSLGKPAFVVGLDAAQGAVILGGDGGLVAQSARLDAGAFAEDVTFPREVTARVRYRHEGVRARLEASPGSGGAALLARFLAPVRAVAPGQVLVAYDGERVLGGATLLSVDTRTATFAAEESPSP